MFKPTNVTTTTASTGILAAATAKDQWYTPSRMSVNAVTAFRSAQNDNRVPVSEAGGAIFIGGTTRRAVMAVI
jgi:hypothetical protein